MPANETAKLLATLPQTLRGEVRADRLSRTLYATDASIYEILPDAVVLPASVDDVAATVRACRQHGVPLTARGAGTGLTGGAVNRGIILDCARHLNCIVHVDPAGRFARVEPGVVLDELNAVLARHDLHFAPDVATSSRATIGGMIANNSCGAHSLVVGRTVNHVHSVDVVLSDGSLCTWGPDTPPSDNPLAAAGEACLADILRNCGDEITARYPRVLRSNGGYGLDRLHRDGRRLNPEAVLCGSEGTLGVVVGATLALTPLPHHRALLVVHYDGVLPALASVPHILEHQPAGVELVDRLILDASCTNPAMARRRRFLVGEPEAFLAVEFFSDDMPTLERRLNDLAADLRSRGIGYAWPILTEPAAQADVWELRKAGLGLLMSRPGDEQPYAFIEDTAVAPARLHDYIRRLGEVLAEEGVSQTGYYAHASVGCLHVRPVLNLKKREDIARLRRIGNRVSSLVLEFGGTMTAEHGDGIIRSGWLEKLYGPRLIAAFRRIKQTFDPDGILNPGKIVDPLPIDENLRFGEGFATQQPQTALDFDAFGGMAGLAGMCTGVGNCRQRLVGTMCPSYMATGDETHTTRARANALRVALSNRGLLDGLADPALDDVFDLCLSCKACRTECPTGTDVARLKTEWLHARNRREGVPRRSRLIASTIRLAAWGSRFAPLSNWLMRSPVARAFLEHWFGLDRRIPPPAFARQTFRQWFKRRPRADTGGSPRPPVVYFVDTWTNYYLPQVGMAAVKVLEALGNEVLVPPTVCCGRPLISKGLLDEARALAEENVRVLGPYAERGVPIVGTEPSCVSVLLDELPQFVRTPAARQVAASVRNIEAYIADVLAERPDALRFRPGARPVLFHGHCHQKALTGTAAALRVLNACTAGGANEINSGCCGMAGSFGHETGHYEIARAIGEQRLFPAVRARGDADIAVAGFSCREHIAHHTDARPRHLIELVADALV
ncbi:MAG: FAD-linked oxidase C-terminal domain-containing protein [Phycisphaerae bacterium]|jgi:FAD/FMN-containing dehydrogenase/Fe-S oxidoreductase